MQDAFDSMLPVATLLLGAGLANFFKFSELRKRLRLDAADQLAVLPTLLWNKTDSDAWLKMNAAVSRLAIRLNLAGVHRDLTERMQVSAIAFWESVHVVGQDDDGDLWTIGEDAHEAWDEISGLVAEFLSTNSRIKSWWVGRRARRLLRKWDDAERALRRSVEESGE